MDIVLILPRKGFRVGCSPDSVVGTLGTGLTIKEHTRIKQFFQSTKDKWEVRRNTSDRVTRMESVDMDRILVKRELTRGLNHCL